MHPSDFDYIVLASAGAPDPSIPIAGSRAGAIGVLNLECATPEMDWQQSFVRLAELGRGRFGVLVGDAAVLTAVLACPGRPLDLVVLAAASLATAGELGAAVRSVHDRGAAVFATCTSLAEAQVAQASGVDAVIAKGHEAGGWVGEEGAFVLLQRLVAHLSVPVWVHGGVGLHTAAACYTAGAAGAVLDSQLLLARESPVPEAVRSLIGAMDGSETVCLGQSLGRPVRLFTRPGMTGAAALQDLEVALAAGNTDDALGRWRAEVAARANWQGGDGSVLALGQDGAFAPDLAQRFRTVSGILAALSDAIVEQVGVAQAAKPLAEGSSWAAAHGTRYPIVQGPMTRVSDRAEFAAAVARDGGVPFLALALMRGPEVEALLADAQRQLGDLPWGVGILGFVPAELRAEQLEVIRSFRPTYALIAGGRPDQAAVLEAQGIPTYLHVASPGLLKLYLRDGARRFVFEGRECGGHVGPRSSFVLWETMVRTLLDELPRTPDATGYDMLFAGGIHDRRSAAMVAAIAAPLVARGVRIGVLVGTAYLFTEEAVAAGAITRGFQDAAVACDSTVLLESGPGHATRCIPSPFAEDFQTEKQALLVQGLASDDLRNRLEVLNVGRLRIAAKGVDHHPLHGVDPAAPKLVSLDDEAQWRNGLFMIGQVAALRDRVVTVAQLHHEISAGSTEYLSDVGLPPVADAEVASETALPPADIAIVGMGCILPGAPDLATFWSNILGRHDAVTEVPATRWDWRQYYDADPSARDKVYSRWGGFIDDVLFDPMVFGMPPATLRSIEPFQLLGLMVARAALQDAGYLDRPFSRLRTSVILGAGGGGADVGVGYTIRALLPKLFGDSATELTTELNGQLPEWTEDSFAGVLMNVAAGRIANRFDLGGTNFTIDAACASSLAAVCMAVRELQMGVSDMAVVGGVDAIQNPFAFLCFSKTHALSPTGRCRPFDAQADGIAISEGFAAMVLKRRVDAERDGDRIYAVIQGVGGASDGRERSLTAPRPEGQRRALRRAYAHAGFSPETVRLVEAHGTGTVAGDSAEVESLSSVFGQAGAGTQSCALGSVKSSIGHTKATAGVAGLIKTALALHHKVLPPTLGVTQPNPKADFESSPFYVNTETRPWLGGDDRPRRAGVSAFGFGGTNFHIVMEEYTGGFLAGGQAPVDPWPAELFVWREPTRSRLATSVAAVLASLDAGAQPALADLAHTLATAAQRTAPGGPTLAIVADSVADLTAKLQEAARLLGGNQDRHHLPNGIHLADAPMAADGQVAFLFPGQGSQRVNMTIDLALAFPLVRECFERADRVLASRLPQALSRYIFPPPTFTPDTARQRHDELTATEVAQPALAATDLACLALLRALGVEPDLVAGHSFGELVALAAAGSLSVEDLLRLAEARGRFVAVEAAGAPGAMAAIDAGVDRLRDLLADGDLVAANRNAPRQTVVSGTTEAIERAVAWCQARQLPAKVLPVACGFHSPLMAGAQGRLAAELAQTDFVPPTIPVFSNTTAGVYPPAGDGIVGLLAEHLVKPVEFVGEIEAMHAAGARLFVEVGPGTVLSGLAGSILGDRPHVCLPVDRKGRPGVTQLLHCLAGLVTEGVGVRLGELFAGRSVQTLRLDNLQPAAGTPATTATAWVVNGGRARPAADTAADAVPPPLQVEVVNPAHPSAARAASPAPAATASPIPALAVPVPVPTPPSSAPAAGLLSAPIPPAPSPAPAAGSSPAPVPLLRTPSPASSGGGPAGMNQVMDRYQGMMQHFLASHEAVMLSFLRGQPAATATASPPVAAAPPLEAFDGPIGRFLLRPTPAPAVDQAGGLAPGGVILIIDGGHGAGGELARCLERRGERVARHDIVAHPLGHPEKVTALVGRVRDLGDRVKALVYLPSGRPTDGPSAVPDDLVGLFLLCQALRGDLESAAADGGAAVLGATAMGGTFGLDGPAGLAHQGALVGFLKTLAQEWPRVRVKAVDADRADADLLLAELGSADGMVEVGYRDGTRLRLESVPAGLAGRTDTPMLDGDSVVLITGGARGITAETAIYLAARYRPTVVVVGRTAAVAEDPATAGLTDLRALKSAIAQQQRQALGAVTPATVEAEYRSLMARREVTDNLARLHATGARIDYRTADVRDERAFGQLIEGVYQRYGHIDGVIHGAGVVEDKLLGDKQLESLRRVVATKLAGAATLAAALRPEHLRFLVFFSSVSGRFGNRGQADYAAASEVLNKLAHDLDRRWPARVVSLNWGPWLTTGMVSPEIRQQFESRGVQLIPVEHGCRRLDEELRFGVKGEVEVMVAGGMAPATVPTTPVPDAVAQTNGHPAAKTNGHATNGHATNGAATNGHATNGHATNGHATNGAATNGHATNGHATNGHATNGHATNGHATNGHATNGHATNGHATNGHATASGNGHAISGHANGHGNGHGRPRLALVPASLAPRFNAAGRIELVRTLDLDNDLYLHDHVVDAIPVFPFAMAMELMAEVVAAGWPDMEVVALRDVQLLRGITVDDGPRPVRVTAVAQPGDRAVDVTISSTGVPAAAHYRAVVELSAPGDRQPALDQPALLGDLAPFDLPIAEAYQAFLFHGPLFQGIEAIPGMGPAGARAVLRPSEPGALLRDGRGAGWLIDPVVVDSALQLTLIWTRRHWDITLLPNRLNRLVQFRAATPGEAVYLEMRIRPESQNPLCHADYHLFGPDGRPLAVVTDMVGAGSKALNRLAAGRPA